MRQLAGLFPEIEYPAVLVGLGAPDDAAVFRLDAERALIKTTDFFTPIVDDPWVYGAIAAANAMSDIYAMGGDILFCLNIAGFPEDLAGEIVAQIFAGGASKVQEAGAAIAGGHTVTNPEPFYGLSVTGLAHPDRILRKSGVRPGDRLVLTKPLGTGILTTASKLTGVGETQGHRLARRAEGKPDLDPDHLQAAVNSMLRLNRAASQAALAGGVHAATDITGFGLLGHASEMYVASRRTAEVGLRIHATDVPLLPGALGYVAAGYLTRGSVRNPAHFAEYVNFDAKVDAALRTLLWEAETSGGLLLAVPQEGIEQFETACAEREQDYWYIGEAIQGANIEVM